MKVRDVRAKLVEGYFSDMTFRNVHDIKVS
jgi:hypothetical protein